MTGKRSRVMLRPELTPEGLKRAALDMYMAITGREPSEEDLAQLNERVAAMKDEQDSTE